VTLLLDLENVSTKTLDMTLPWRTWVFHGALQLAPIAKTAPPPWVSKPGACLCEVHTLAPKRTKRVTLVLHRTKDGADVCFLNDTDKTHADAEGCEQRLTLGVEDALTALFRVSEDGSFTPSNVSFKNARFTGEIESNEITIKLK
jgi:hypothetical protein